MNITQIKLSFSNAYLVRGHKTILVDMGMPGEEDKINRPFPAVTPDLLLDNAFDLNSFGVEGCILPTPGHTAGSIALLLADGTAVVGDVMMGGVMGGALFGARPNYHYFAEDVTAVQSSIRSLLAAGVQTFYVGHGGPLRRADVEKRFAGTA
ncbi:MAG: hypothetical protein IPM39_29010 [Chloroflexi bacterium]|nr:hypothetical protein [Chloroflexota bacterium]